MQHDIFHEFQASGGAVGGSVRSVHVDMPDTGGSAVSVHAKRRVGEAPSGHGSGTDVSRAAVSRPRIYADVESGRRGRGSAPSGSRVGTRRARHANDGSCTGFEATDCERETVDDMEQTAKEEEDAPEEEQLEEERRVRDTEKTVDVAAKEVRVAMNYTNPGRARYGDGRRGSTDGVEVTKRPRRQRRKRDVDANEARHVANQSTSGGAVSTVGGTSPRNVDETNGPKSRSGTAAPPDDQRTNKLSVQNLTGDGSGKGAAARNCSSLHKSVRSQRSCRDTSTPPGDQRTNMAATQHSAGDASVKRVAAMNGSPSNKSIKRHISRGDVAALPGDHRTNNKIIQPPTEDDGGKGSATRISSSSNKSVRSQISRGDIAALPGDQRTNKTATQNAAGRRSSPNKSHRTSQSLAINTPEESANDEAAISVGKERTPDVSSGRNTSPSSTSSSSGNAPCRRRDHVVSGPSGRRDDYGDQRHVRAKELGGGTASSSHRSLDAGHPTFARAPSSRLRGNAPATTESDIASRAGGAGKAERTRRGIGEAVGNAAARAEHGAVDGRAGVSNDFSEGRRGLIVQPQAVRPERRNVDGSVDVSGGVSDDISERQRRVSFQRQAARPERRNVDGSVDVSGGVSDDISERQPRVSFQRQAARPERRNVKGSVDGRAGVSNDLSEGRRCGPVQRRAVRPERRNLDGSVDVSGGMSEDISERHRRVSFQQQAVRPERRNVDVDGIAGVSDDYTEGRRGVPVERGERMNTNDIQPSASITSSPSTQSLLDAVASTTRWTSDCSDDVDGRLSNTNGGGADRRGARASATSAGRFGPIAERTSPDDQRSMRDAAGRGRQAGARRNSSIDDVWPSNNTPMSPAHRSAVGGNHNWAIDERDVRVSDGSSPEWYGQSGDVPHQKPEVASGTNVGRSLPLGNRNTNAAYSSGGGSYRPLVNSKTNAAYSSGGNAYRSMLTRPNREFQPPIFQSETYFRPGTNAVHYDRFVAEEGIPSSRHLARHDHMAIHPDNASYTFHRYVRFDANQTANRALHVTGPASFQNSDYNQPSYYSMQAPYENRMMRNLNRRMSICGHTSFVAYRS